LILDAAYLLLSGGLQGDARLSLCTSQLTVGADKLQMRGQMRNR